MINDYYLDAEMEAWEKATDNDCVDKYDGFPEKRLTDADDAVKSSGWICPVCEVRVSEITELTVKHWCDNCKRYHSQLECYNEDDFSKSKLLRLAQQLETAEEQGWRFERYARCGVAEHRHRWAVTAWLCGWLTPSR